MVYVFELVSIVVGINALGVLCALATPVHVCDREAGGAAPAELSVLRAFCETVVE